MSLYKSVPLEEVFTYHPLVTEARKEKHDLVNQASFEYAQRILSTIKDPDIKEQIIVLIQQVRMLMNQAITFEEIKQQNQGD